MADKAKLQNDELRGFRSEVAAVLSIKAPLTHGEEVSPLKE
jgi:hypothetical protein